MYTSFTSSTDAESILAIVVGRGPTDNQVAVRFVRHLSKGQPSPQSLERGHSRTIPAANPTAIMTPGEATSVRVPVVVVEVERERADGVVAQVNTRNIR
jgi:hypothetical protein